MADAFEGLEGVWVFNGSAGRAAFPGGVFRTQAAAEAWIAKHRLSGTLSWYPLDVGMYDLAVDKGWFQPKTPAHASARFIGGFSSEVPPHFHYEDGE